MIARTVLVAVVIASPAVAACKSREPAPATVPEPVADATPDALEADAGTDAAPDASLADLGQLDPSFLDGAELVKGGGTVDATSLGATIDVRVLERVTDRNTGMQVVEILLVVSGTRTIAVELGSTWDYGLEEGTAPGTLIVIGEEEDPKPWSADDDPVEKRLPSRQPMLYRFSMSSPHLTDSFAIVREKDALVGYSFFTDEGEDADAWEKQATVKLARGATLRFP